MYRYMHEVVEEIMIHVNGLCTLWFVYRQPWHWNNKACARALAESYVVLLVLQSIVECKVCECLCMVCEKL